MAVDALTPWKLLTVVALVLLNGFFVASEFAIVKVRRTQLAARQQKGDRRAELATHVVDHLDAYLSATQLGITFASLGLGWVGEPFIAALLEGPFIALSIGSPVVVHAAAFVVAFAIITVLHIVIGELAPKSLAIQRAVGVSLWTARPLHGFYVAFKPFIWVLNGLANRIVRAFGIHPASEGDAVHSEEELRLLLAEAGTKKALKRERAEFLLRALRLNDIEARNAMTPRTRVVTLDAKGTFEANLAKARAAGYTRFPVIDGDIDKVVGMAHYREIHEIADGTRPGQDLRSILRPTHFVAETAPLENVLEELLRRSVHMAVVTDEFGSTAGIITLEDIFEEIFGEIRDEFDTTEGEGPIRQVGKDHYILEGMTPLHQASDALGLGIESSEVTTIGGYVIAELGHLPSKGERIAIGSYSGSVREVGRHRIQSVELWRQADDAT